MEHNNMVHLDPSRALLGFLSDNWQNPVQNNTVVVQQEKMERVGFEPTTSAMPTVDRKKVVQIPRQSQRIALDKELFRFINDIKKRKEYPQVVVVVALSPLKYALCNCKAPFL